MSIFKKWQCILTLNAMLATLVFPICADTKQDFSTFTPQDWQNLSTEERVKLKEQTLSALDQKRVSVIIDQAGRPLTLSKGHSAKKDCSKKPKPHKDTKVSCCCGKGISNKDINQHGAGYMISKPGEYFIEEDLIFNPVVAGAAAIVINADNVILHLCNKVLRQQSSNTQPGTVGILVNGKKNVSLDGGTVQDFNTFGIFVNQNTDILSMTRLNVINCGTTAAGNVGGVLILPSNSIKVTDSKFLENYGIAFSIAGCTNFEMDNCSCDNTKGSAIFPFGTTASGFLAGPFPTISPNATPSENITLTNSTFSNSTGTFEAFGVTLLSFNSIIDIKNVLIENCISNGCTGGPFSDEVEGISVIGTNAVIKSCIVDNVTSGFGTPFSGMARGFRCVGANIIFEDCVASNIIGSGPVAAAGFTVEGTAEDINWIGCKAYNIANSGLPNVYGYGDAYGFGVNERGSYIAELIFPGSPIFDFNLGVGNVLDRCTSENIVTNVDNTIAAGFRFTSQQNLLVQDCISNNSSSYGFWFIDGLGDPDSSNGIVQNNVLEGSTTAGIFDETLANNAYIANIARSNGLPGSNYIGLPAGTPIAVWTIPGVTPVINPLDNLDIRP